MKIYFVDSASKEVFNGDVINITKKYFVCLVTDENGFEQTVYLDKKNLGNNWFFSEKELLSKYKDSLVQHYEEEEKKINFKIANCDDKLRDYWCFVRGFELDGRGYTTNLAESAAMYFLTENPNVSSVEVRDAEGQLYTYQITDGKLKLIGGN